MVCKNLGLEFLNAHAASYQRSTNTINHQQQELNTVEYRISERARLISLITKAEVDGKQKVDFSASPELKQLLERVIGFAEPKIDFLGDGYSLKKERFKHQIELIKEAGSQDQQKGQNLFLQINQTYQDAKDITDITSKAMKSWEDTISHINRNMAS